MLRHLRDLSYSATPQLKDDIDTVLEAVPDPAAATPTEPHELAALFVKAKRRARVCDAEAKKMKALGARLVQPILDQMKAGRWPTSATVDGANMHRKGELYVSPLKRYEDDQGNPIEWRDHGFLTESIETYMSEHPEDSTNWASLLPSTVNSNSLKATVNDFIKEYDFTLEQKMLPVEERLKIAGFPQVILDALDISEGYSVNANGL